MTLIGHRSMNHPQQTGRRGALDDARSAWDEMIADQEPDPLTETH
jgi:hypothetical protein